MDKKVKWFKLRMVGWLCEVFKSNVITNYLNISAKCSEKKVIGTLFQSCCQLYLTLLSPPYIS